MIGPAGAAGGVCSGVNARKSPEVISEVGLVVVATVERELGPGDVDAGVQLMDGSLKALDTAPSFGTETDSLSKDL